MDSMSVPLSSLSAGSSRSPLLFCAKLDYGRASDAVNAGPKKLHSGYVTVHRFAASPPQLVERLGNGGARPHGQHAGDHRDQDVANGPGEVA